MSRASISEVLDCMSLLATLTQSSMLRTEWPIFRPMSQSGIEQAVNDAGQVRQRANAGGDLPVVQEHEVNVAVRVKLGPAIPADGHQRQLRKLLPGLFGQAGFGRVPEVAQQRVEDRGASMADFEAARAGAMPQLEPVRFHLEEGLVAGQFLGGLPARRQRQARGGARFNLLKQFLHSGITLGAKPSRRKRPRKPCDRCGVC